MNNMIGEEIMKVLVTKGTMTSRPGLPAWDEGLDRQQFTVMSSPCGCQVWRYETLGHEDTVRKGYCSDHSD